MKRSAHTDATGQEPARVGPRLRRGRRPAAQTGERPPVAAPTRWWDTPFWLATGGGLLLWAALPPLRWWPLAWVAPLCWLRLVARPRAPGRRGYLAIWASAALYWIVVMQGIRLAHWATYIGLVALGLYLAVYLPLFIAVARHAVHAWRVPLVWAAPIAWTGVELIRGYGPLGFSMATLAHTQVEQLRLIQVADLCGAYGVSFLMMLAAASLWALMQGGGWRRCVGPGALLALALGLMLGYGTYRLGQPPAEPDGRGPLRVALIQGSIDTLFDDDPQRPWEMLSQYSALTEQARAQFSPVDLVVWPESMFPVADMLIDPSARADQQLVPERWLVERTQETFQRVLKHGIAQINADGSGATSWVLGTSTWHVGTEQPEQFNAALLVVPPGDVVARYYKMHPVMFGEYVPLGTWIPALYRLFPMPSGLTAGQRAEPFTVGDWVLAPSICFENTIPHLIRGHFAQLARRGRRPDVLINLTNDGWFWGSSILDLQLDCAVLRAVELRRPFLVAANTGFSAWIDGNGRVQAQGPRRATATLLATVTPDRRWSGYQQWGDLPAGGCALCCAAAAAAGLWAAVRARPPQPPDPA